MALAPTRKRATAFAKTQQIVTRLKLLRAKLEALPPCDERWAALADFDSLVRTLTEHGYYDLREV